MFILIIYVCIFFYVYEIRITKSTLIKSMKFFKVKFEFILTARSRWNTAHTCDLDNTIIHPR